MSNDKVAIQIGSADGPSFKSIKNLSWEDIPPFAVVTGRNGAGKSQLLEFLALRLTNAARYQSPDAQKVHFSLTGINLQPDEVVFVPSHWSLGGVQSVSLAQLREAKDRVEQYLRQESGSIDHQRRRAKFLKLFGAAANLQPHERQDLLKDDFSFLIDEGDVGSALSHIFVAYRLKILRALENKQTDAEVLEKHGRPPWEVLNEILQAAEFEYSVNSPIGTDLLDQFTVLLTSRRGDVIAPSALSSGEQSILQVVLWLYYSQQYSSFPKLMLLDEPDAHLHPAMTRQFLSVLHDVLVKKYDVRIILATHSPSTVALAPQGSVFEMRRADSFIKAVPSKQYAIGLLTSGLLTVGEGTRFCFVEDHDDVIFYNTVRDILTDFGPGKDAGSLAPAPTIVFLPVSAGKGNTKVAGGCAVVVEWVNRFSGSGLSDAFRGIIDWDGKNQASSGVEVLSRYSFENYLLDPIVLFVATLNTPRSVSVEGVKIEVGDEHLLRDLGVTKLQAIADAVLVEFENVLPHLQPEDRGRLLVNFTSGITLSYPRWLLERRGKDLLQGARNAFGISCVAVPNLVTALKRVRLIPEDLSNSLKKLQAS